MDKKSVVNISFNSIKENPSDPSLLDVKMIICDFKPSYNKQCITQEVCEQYMHTLVDKRIVCKYISADDNLGVDSLKDHAEYLTEDKDGNQSIETDTIACGFIKKVYIDDFTDENGTTEKVLYAEGVLWNDEKYRKITSLLKDWIERGIKVNSSCEYLYPKCEVVDGIEYPSQLLFTGHCILNSEERGEVDVVEGAYDVSQILSLNDKNAWNTALNSLNKIVNNKEVKDVEKNNIMFEMLKSTNAISASGFRWRIYNALEKVMLAEEYNNMYLSDYDIYPTEGYFMYETYVSDLGCYKLFKATFTVGEDDTVAVDYEGKQEMEYKCDLVPVEDLKQSLNDKETELAKKVAELETVSNELGVLKESLNAKETEIKGIKEEKVGVETKLNEQAELVISLNSKVQELEGNIEVMKPIVEAHEKAEFEMAFNSAKETYREKFDKVGALEIFEDDDTQELIRKSVNSTTNEYKAQLNQLIIDNIKTTIKVEEESEPMVKSINSIVKGKEVKNLLPESNVYEDMSGIKVD